MTTFYGKDIDLLRRFLMYGYIGFLLTGLISHGFSVFHLGRVKVYCCKIFNPFQGESILKLEVSGQLFLLSKWKQGLHAVKIMMAWFE
jgi:hypothetical protein